MSGRHLPNRPFLPYVGPVLAGIGELPLPGVWSIRFRCDPVPGADFDANPRSATLTDSRRQVDGMVIFCAPAPAHSCSSARSRHSAPADAPLPRSSPRGRGRTPCDPAGGPHPASCPTTGGLCGPCGGGAGRMLPARGSGLISPPGATMSPVFAIYCRRARPHRPRFHDLAFLQRLTRVISRPGRNKRALSRVRSLASGHGHG